MYEKYYGLSERPFDLTPNWRYLYLTPTHREALTAVQYGISARRGIVVVLGEAGTGKTTIVRSAIRALRRSDVRHVYLTNPMLTRSEFLKFLSQAFKLDPSTADCKVDLIRELTNQLKRQHAAGKATVLIVDEAQSMPHELLEEIRLLANIETPSAKLLQVVLLGQPELADRLNDPSLRQLKQRIAIRCALKPLDLKSTAALVAGRIRVAGGKPAELFTSRAVELVYLHSGGVPRTINVICDNALLSGYAADVRPIGGDIIEEVCREFDLPRRPNLVVVDAPAAAQEPVAKEPAAAESVSREPAPVRAETEAVRPAVTKAPVVEAAAKPAAAVTPAKEASGVSSVPPATAADIRMRPSPTERAVQHTGTAADGPAPDLFSSYGKPRRFSLLSWVRG
jgi:general secretion pathway protein A